MRTPDCSKCGRFNLRLHLVHETIQFDKQLPLILSSPEMLAEAFTLAVSNSKAVLCFVTVFAQVIQADVPKIEQAFFLVLTYCAISIASLSTYARLAAILHERLMTHARYRGFRIVSGSVLLGFAAELAREISWP